MDGTDRAIGRSAPASGRVPLAVKIIYTAFMAVMIPVYLWYYGPTNFLYFCDQALLFTLVGVWLESPLLLSIPAAGILLPQLLWIADFLGALFGAPLLGMTGYMFNPETSLFLRGLSTFHGWLPLLLVYLVFRTGYDARAMPVCAAITTVTLLVCFFFMPPPRSDAGLTPVNINYVWGPDDKVAQSWMPAYAWLALLLVGMPAVFVLPAHLALKRFAPRPA